MASGFFPLLILAAIHLYANKAKILGWIWHGLFLSFAGGVSFAYVFVDLLPSLEEGQPVLEQTFGFIPYLNRHAYVLALFGVLFYYGLKSFGNKSSLENYWLLMSGYLLFNFFVGVTLSDPTDPTIQPLFLFVIAMGLHYFVNDHNLRENQEELYDNYAKWVLAGALFAGYIVGSVMRIPNYIVAILVSFVAGGVVFNVFHYELPQKQSWGFLSFVFGALIYTAILLSIGE